MSVKCDVTGMMCSEYVRLKTSAGDKIVAQSVFTMLLLGYSMSTITRRHAEVAKKLKEEGFDAFKKDQLLCNEGHIEEY